MHIHFTFYIEFSLTPYEIVWLQNLTTAETTTTEAVTITTTAATTAIPLFHQGRRVSNVDAYAHPNKGCAPTP